jgi:hypothetical protein
MSSIIQLDTDFEYILLPVEYRGPTNELRPILETIYIHKARGRINGNVVPGSNASEYHAVKFRINYPLKTIDTAFIRQPDDRPHSFDITDG